jgi:hypothetical protein
VNYNSVVHVASARLLLGRFTVAWAVTGQPKNKEKLKTVEIGSGWAQAQPAQFIFSQGCFWQKRPKTLLYRPLYFIPFCFDI